MLKTTTYAINVVVVFFREGEPFVLVSKKKKKKGPPFRLGIFRGAQTGNRGQTVANPNDPHPKQGIGPEGGGGATDLPMRNSLRTMLLEKRNGTAKKGDTNVWWEVNFLRVQNKETGALLPVWRWV